MILRPVSQQRTTRMASKRTYKYLHLFCEEEDVRDRRLETNLGGVLAGAFRLRW